MFCVIPLILLVSNALALPTADKPYYDLADAKMHFLNFIRKYEKRYDTKEEFNARFEIFKEHLVNINNLNQMHETSYDVNNFSDMSIEEFTRNRYGLVLSYERSYEDELVTVQDEWIEDAPESLDYRTQGLVTPARDQGQCGSCYAFAGIAAIEGQHAKKNKELLVLSVQQGLDCDRLDMGCGGGANLVNILNELAKQGGSELEEDYVYEGKNDVCRTNASKIAVKVTGGFEIDTPTDDELIGALAKFGPLSVAMNAIGLYPDYKGGVISPSPEDCDPNSINHGVLLVGYGTEEKKGGKKYWIVKNSWGASWGDKGFFYLERGLCGLGTFSTTCAKVE